MRPLGLASVFVIAWASAFVSCKDVSRFSTADGQSYCGVVTGGSFVRAGIVEGTRMRLQLDASALEYAPGRVWSDELAPGEKLQASVLRSIPQLQSDELSNLTFGEGRVKNAIAVVDLAEADAGPVPSQAFLVLSLLQSGDVEVRLMRGASPGSAPPGAPAEPPQLFGIFRLSREDGDCGLP